MPGRHSGDQVHKVKKTAAPLLVIFYLQGPQNQYVLTAICAAHLLTVGVTALFYHDAVTECKKLKDKDR